MNRVPGLNDNFSDSTSNLEVGDGLRALLAALPGELAAGRLRGRGLARAHVLAVEVAALALGEADLEPRPVDKDSSEAFG